MTEKPLSVAALFAGVGGIEQGLQEATGFNTEYLCEIDPTAQAVLSHHFSLPVHDDVRLISEIPPVDLLTAGFPCQDLSQAGRKAGITGDRSSLVGNIFRLIDEGHHRPPWVLIENVSYMLRLDQGKAMKYLVDEFERHGYRWAYRVVDARAFGVPQRRQRVIFLASTDGRPETVLFADNADDNSVADDRSHKIDSSAVYGFYWTEGLRGLGWVKNAVPTIKGGSSLGIPSPPAVWIPETGEIGTPSLTDSERLQGFDAGWTKPADDLPGHKNPRWRLVGNAVCVPMARWVGDRINQPGLPIDDVSVLQQSRPWPRAAYGSQGVAYSVNVSMRPLDSGAPNLRSFLSEPLKPLSLRATKGFYDRTQRSTTLRFADEFIDAVRTHICRMESEGA